jgi:DNA-binding NtrC family response regulator
MIAQSYFTPTLLVIDDEDPLLKAFRGFFREPEVRLLTAPTAADGLRLAEEHRPDAVILSLNVPDLDGMEAFRRIRELDARIPVILMTENGTSQTAIEAIKQGAYDYVVKPRGLAEVRKLVAGAFQVSRAVRLPAVTAQESAPENAGVMIGCSPHMQEVYKAIGRVAPQDVTVLITGESGTGKELVARAVFQHSRRASSPFLAINCAAIPEALLESELFGHERGAFTGADRQRVGKFEQCSGGTLFLDEVGDMPPLTQVKLLRVLQEQAFERVGGDKTIRTDVRVIAATNRDLEKLVAEGRFRADLYYRLSVFGIHLPPLRERLEDLPLLVEHFLNRFSREMGKKVSHAMPEVLDRLRGRAWPGNLRELQSVLKQALLRAHGPVLLPDFLPAAPLKEEGGREAVLLGQELPLKGPAHFLSSLPDLDLFLQEQIESGTTDLYAEVTELVDRHVLSLVLAHTGGNRLRAARILGVTRGTLRAKLRAFGLAAERPARSDTYRAAGAGPGGAA